MTQNSDNVATHAQMCIERLREDILHGYLKPGDKLQTQKLSSRYEVGSSPIREALFHLSTTGLIEFNLNKGFKVATITKEAIRDVYRTLTQIEILALEQAIELGDEQWEGQVMAQLHCLGNVENKQCACDYKVWVQRNRDFHAALVSGCGSTELIRIRHDLNQRFEWLGYLAFLDNPQPLKLNHCEHQALAQAAVNRKKNQIPKLVREHIGDPETLMIPILKRRGLL